ncbi:MAG: hypothetical protein LBV32_04050, partial [Tannerellaceae bacterium]|nr:hypothetical protein [Tannerellaceae bacterium]
LEYNLGYGTFAMANLKDALSESSVELNNLKVTDNFPAHFTHQAKMGYAFNHKHQVGLALDLMNTVGNKSVSDYSGSYNFTIRTKGTRLGGFYRVSTSPKEHRLRPYLQLTAGVVLNSGKALEKLVIGNETLSEEKISLEGVNTFIEPAIGFKYRLWGNLALNLTGGYEIDLSKKFTDKSGQYQIEIYPDWSGFRIQCGLIYTLPN